jgi:N-methylhydantoinase A
LGVDVGGTFTDLVAVSDDGGLRFAKVPSVPADPSVAVMSAVGASGVPAADVVRFAHGSTVATNALLERRGAVTALVTTHGFRDVIEIGRQDRPALYDLTQGRPATLVPRDARFTVTERCGPHGVLTPLDEAQVQALADRLADLPGVAAVAVCLLFSFLHPDHERQVAGILRARLPGVSVVCSSDVLPQFREYERFATTVAQAFLAPAVGSYLDRLADRVDRAGLPRPVVMQSSGGVVDLEVAAVHAAAGVMSGPAAGVVGAAFVAGSSGIEDLLTFDMGGTSTDVASVLGGQVAMTTSSVVAGVPIMHPAVDVHSVSAGGGSIAWVDSGGALRVGPVSAGADPGPACYGRGGTAATVTDADLLLGCLPDEAVFGGTVRLSRAAAEDVLGALGQRLGLSPVAAAEGVVAVADAEMARALRVVSVERGLDPRELTMVAFGGAGGVHACALAEELGVRRVLVPQACGVLSALGLAVGDVRRDYVAPLLGRVDADRWASAFARLQARADGDLAGARHARYADCRYVGQSHELTVPVSGRPSELREAFEAEHVRRYGYTLPDRDIETVAVRLVAPPPVDRPRRAAAATDHAAAPGRRSVWLSGGWQEVQVLPGRALGAGDAVTGPAVVEFPEATCLLRPGWQGRVDKVGALVLERS